MNSRLAGLLMTQMTAPNSSSCLFCSLRCSLLSSKAFLLWKKRPFISQILVPKISFHLNWQNVIFAMPLKKKEKKNHHQDKLEAWGTLSSLLLLLLLLLFLWDSKDFFCSRTSDILRIVMGPLQVAGRNWNIFPHQYSAQSWNPKAHAEIPIGTQQKLSTEPNLTYWVQVSIFGALTAYGAIRSIVCSAIAHKSSGGGPLEQTGPTPHSDLAPWNQFSAGPEQGCKTGCSPCWRLVPVCFCFIMKFESGAEGLAQCPYNSQFKRRQPWLRWLRIGWNQLRMSLAGKTQNSLAVRGHRWSVNQCFWLAGDVCTLHQAISWWHQWYRPCSVIRGLFTPRGTVWGCGPRTAS